MRFRYKLPDHLSEQARHLKEFANGAMQVTVKLRSGREVKQVLLSDACYIIAVRGYTDLPFSVDEIVDVYQSVGDERPADRSGWHFWDQWE